MPRINVYLSKDNFYDAIKELGKPNWSELLRKGIELAIQERRSEIEKYDDH